MDFRGDRRAQAMQVGAVVVVGVAIVALSVYQVTSVPQQNRQIEAAHSDQVRGQLLTMRAAILETARTGTGHAATVSLGPAYPDRFLAVNPSPPAGTLWTSTASLVIANATATDPETADFWDGSERAYATRGIAYTPEYNEFTGAPATGYEHSLAYDLYGADVFESSATIREGVALSNQTLIDGREITIVALDGSFSATGTENVSVAARPVSVSNTTVPITNATDGPIVLSIPTRATNETWGSVLSDQLVEAGGYVEGYECRNPDDRGPCGVLTVTLRTTGAEEPYVLRTAKIGVGEGATREPPRYLTNVTDRTVRVPENRSRTIVLEVRDRYDNPVSGERVNLTVVDRAALERLGSAPGDGGGVGELRADGERGTEIEAITDERGRVSAQYVAPANTNGSDPMNVTVLADRTAPPSPQDDGETANGTAFDVSVANADGSPAPHALRWNRTALASHPDVRCGPNGCTYNRSEGRFVVPANAITAAGDPVPNAEVRFRSEDPGTARYVDRETVTGDDGVANATVAVSRPRNATLLVAGARNNAGGGDRLNLTVENRPPNATTRALGNVTSGTPMQFSAGGSTDPDGRIVEYEWDFDDGSQAFGRTPRHAYEQPGTYDVTLTVTDEHGAVDTANTTIEIANRPPDAAFAYPLAVLEPGQSVQFDASESGDPDGEIVRYEWAFGDGTTATRSMPTVSHAYDEPGTYTVALRITDDSGDTAIVRKSITIDD